MALDPDNPTTAVVGAPSDGQGMVYVYAVDASGTWSLQQALAAAGGAAGNELGHNAMTDGTTAVVTAIGENNFTGSAYVFTNTGGTCGVLLIRKRAGS